MNQHQAELDRGDRFGFGANWSEFLRLLDDSRIAQAEQSLLQMLNVGSLEGKSFLDVGSGSGLFSLAARRLGARVYSFDYDPQSVNCTRELKRRYFPEDSNWFIGTGSVLDQAFMSSLGTFDIVYSWGVLHHTGDQKCALQNILLPTRPGGLLFIALYNDQGWISSYWTWIKRLYNRHPTTKPLLIIAHAPYLLFGRFAVRALTGRLREARGMSLWYDMIDWLGGWPFEVSRPDAIVSQFVAQGWNPVKVVSVGNRPGCNEFVFVRQVG